MNLPWPYRRIAPEEAFSVPEVYQALRDWAATADSAEPDQDFWDKRKIYHRNAERIFGISPSGEPKGRRRRLD